VQATFYVWVTLLSPAGVDPLMAKLIRRGFKVCALADDGSLMLDSEFACLVALQLEHANIPPKTGNADTKPLQFCFRALKESLNELGLSRHSIIAYQVGGPGGHTWDGPHYVQPPKPKTASSETQIERVEKAIGD
jgi:hypothetical protein